MWRLYKMLESTTAISLNPMLLLVSASKSHVDVTVLPRVTKFVDLSQQAIAKSDSQYFPTMISKDITSVFLTLIFRPIPAAGFVEVDHKLLQVIWGIR